MGDTIMSIDMYGQCFILFHNLGYDMEGIIYQDLIIHYQ